MEPRIVRFESMTITGIGAPFISNLLPGSNAQKVIPGIWDNFMRRRDEIPAKVADVTYGVITGGMDMNNLHYIAGIEVEPGDRVPEGMETVEVVEGNYAVFTHRGPISDLPQTTRTIYQDSLPQSGLTMRDAPHVELYDGRFDPSSPTSEFDILVPVV
ncbi:MAG: transcriptional regulator [Bryobacterales bacterium]|jgi:AraC family transcriptional regulator|nr:transcriptional regulator [Bryobacterales bacterium]